MGKLLGLARCAALAIGALGVVATASAQGTAPSCSLPANFTVLVNPGETSIAAGDPRIPTLAAVATGGGGPLAVSDNRPASFPLGSTTVQFSVNGVPGCSTVVYVVPSSQQLAFFDGPVLKLHRLEDGQLAYQISPAGGPGPISFNSAGSKLAVRSSGRVSIFNASNGALELADTGVYTDFAFRPGSAEDRGYVEEFAGQAHALKVVIGGVTSTQLLLPPAGMARSKPRLAWGPDGTKVAVMFTEASASENRLRVQEWSVAGGTLAALPDVAPRALAAGVTLLGLRATSSDYDVATSAGLFRLTASALNPVLASPLTRIDLHREGMLAMDVASPAAEPPNNATVVLVRGYAFTPEPMTGQVRGYAVSDYQVPSEPILAVARTAYVAVYRLAEDELVLDRQFRAEQPAFPAFRPRGR